MNHAATSNALNREMELFVRQTTAEWTVRQRLQHHAYSFGDLGFCYSWNYITNRKAFVGVFNDAYGSKNGVISRFQKNLGSICSIITFTSVFDGFVDFADTCSQRAFEIVILTNHLEWWYGVSLYTRLCRCFDDWLFVIQQSPLKMHFCICWSNKAAEFEHSIQFCTT